jgi:hypothetical protein
MILKDTYYNSLPNQLRIDQLYSSRSSKDTIIKDLGQAILKVYLRPMKRNKLKGET